jgi:hypothetical protein
METVCFISVETGTDLILSFALQAVDDPETIESLILMRTPKYEFILEEFERRVSVHFERHGDDEIDYLEAVELLRTDQIVRIKSMLHEYELDVRKLGTNDFHTMRHILRRMNFDNKFQVAGF